jgi:hypothetical protein
VDSNEREPVATVDPIAREIDPERRLRREISIFDPQFVRPSRFDIRFACLSKYNPEHMNSFNLRDSSLFLSFSLLMAWQRTVLPFPRKEENALLPALFARTRSRTSAAQTRGRDWRRRNQPPSGSGHSGAGPPATSSPHPPPDQLAGGPHSPHTQSARAEASWGVHRVWPINERLPLDRTPRRSPPHCSWSSSIAAGVPSSCCPCPPAGARRVRWRLRRPWRRRRAPGMAPGR